ncbi:L,D-transpeptidase [Olivibacter sp. SDN3]|uniref:L,D-transpeptidase n=1 Tax=Olivibacter sp. SDN3 TaxID=2764720 RepID=UPI001651AB9E|nr:L,D-transpeptidase [Olivibacter sp. SDN3]QNL48628.1 L,D-transpeptidase [Olivibacter sp. SDN3]
MKRRLHLFTLILTVFLCILFGCENRQSHTDETSSQEKEAKKPDIKPFDGNYETFAVKGNDSALQIFKNRFDVVQQHHVLALNRIDFDNFNNVDTLIIPDTVLQDFNSYTPFPIQVKELAEVEKIVFFSYPIQAFAVYENGGLARWGPTSMGSKEHPTKTGLSFANWKAEEHVSTADDEWLLKWNFNIRNKEGIGWHQYAMPGYPASHSCLRLLENDAKWLYDWADQWIVEVDQHILAEGTPVMVFGTYDFDAERPWLKLTGNPNANKISETDLLNEVKPHLEEILEAQQNRSSIETHKTDSL